MNRMVPMNNAKTQNTFTKDNMWTIVKTACRFLPALLLSVMLIVSLVKADFQIRGEDKTDLIYLIVMILMLGISIILGVLGRSRISQGFGVFLYAVVPFAIDGEYVCYALSYTGGAVIKWFRDKISAEKSYKVLDESVKDEPTGILVMPHFAGGANPYMDIESKAAFL